MNTHSDIDSRRSDTSTDDKGGHGLLAMLACCLPMIAVFALIALRVI